MSNNNENNGNNNRNGRRGGSIFTFLIVFMMIGIVGFWIVRMFTNHSDKDIDYNQFLQMVEEGKVEKVVIGADRLMVYPKEEKTGNYPEILMSGLSKNVLYVGKVEEDETVSRRMIAKGIEVSGEIPSNTGEIWIFVLSYILPIALIIFFGFLLMRRISKSDGFGGIMNVGKSNAKVYVQKETGITFKDVAGEDEAIESIQEVVDFLHNPDKYAKIGAKLPKGALLVGPPGTGKTLLAKAVAGEANVPFFSLTGSDFVEMYVGVGASRVRDLFKEAEKNAPCIVFIDEIDAIGRSRDSKIGGGNEEREQTLNQLLSEMDGFDAKKGIIILAATNRPEILDKALLRPGRFDRRIIVNNPDLKGRIEILKVHSKDVRMDESVNLEEIALATSGAAGADLANMINEAAINAVKEKREFVNQKDLLDAVEIVICGKEKKNHILTAKERKIVCYHEVGHALVTVLQKNTEPVQKITIVPRTMGSLGHVLQAPEEEKNLNSKEELREELVVFLAGRAAEEIVFNSITDGAHNDIEKATKIARSMVTMLGMSDTFGPIALEHTEGQYLNNRVVLNCSYETESKVDQEVIRMLKECYEEAKSLLLENREIMDKIAEYLIQKETITGREFMEIYCAEKGIPVPEPKKITIDETKRSQTDFEPGPWPLKKEDSDEGKGQTIDLIANDSHPLASEGNSSEQEIVEEAVEEAADGNSEQTEAPNDSDDDGDMDDFSKMLNNRTFK